MSSWTRVLALAAVLGGCGEGPLKNLEEGKVFKRDQKVVWRCRNCGYLHEGNAAPDECPACKHEMAYFELLGENY